MSKRFRVAAGLTLVLVTVGYFCFDYLLNREKNSLTDMITSGNYRIIKEADQIDIHFFIKPEWIPFESKKPNKLNMVIAEKHNTKIILNEIWNQGDRIQFSFHSLYDLHNDNGKFLSNKMINDDGSYTNSSLFSNYQLTNLAEEKIILVGLTNGPDSQFSFDIGSVDFDKIKIGFNVKYTAMNLYRYSPR